MEIMLKLSILFTLLFSFHSIKNVEGQTPPFKSIYQFGDSISDTGNDLKMNPNSGCGKPPYGVTFGKPTGRCCDGLLIVDYVAKAYKLPLLNPYQDKSANFTQGVNFAVNGAQAIGGLPVQLGWFKAYLATLCSHPTECTGKLQNALFIMGAIGGNDYMFAASQGKDMNAMVPKVVGAISTTVKELIDLGAKRFVVPGSFPAGELGALHNTQLQAAITTIRQQNPGVKIVYGDYYNAFLGLVKNAPALGFDANGLFRACCEGCGSPQGKVCPDPNTRVSWDGLHFTQHAYQVIAEQLLKDISTL